jgi:hypothetical protein
MRPYGYSFDVLRDETIIHTEIRSVGDSPAEMWRIVSELSARFYIPGTRIVVHDASGRVLVSVGVVSALKLAPSAA